MLIPCKAKTLVSEKVKTKTFNIQKVNTDKVRRKVDIFFINESQPLSFSKLNQQFYQPKPYKCDVVPGVLCMPNHHPNPLST